jgi:L-rhamnonate dehydratase
VSQGGSGGIVHKIHAVSLPPQPHTAATVLPDWAAPAIRQFGSSPWPETQRWFAIEVHDDAGNVGAYGPCSSAVVEVIRDQLAPVLLGWPVDAWRPLRCLRAVGRHRHGPQFRLAISALELALWDLRSRRSGRPVAELLGGRCRRTAVAYATALGIDVDHPVALDVARWIAEAGFWGQKWHLPGVDRDESVRLDADRVRRLREAVGPDARLMIDGLGRWNRASLLGMLPSLAEAEVTWVEEPTADGWRWWPVVHLALAAGEHCYDPDDQIETVMSGSVQVWQPDIAWHGGLTQALTVVDLAASRGIPTFPHASSLPAALHLAALCDEAALPAVEYHLTLDPRRHAVLEQPPTPSNGLFALPAEPGLTGPYRLGAGSTVTLAAGGPYAC